MRNQAMQGCLLAAVVLTGCAHARSVGPMEGESLEHRQAHFHAAVAAGDADGLAAFFLPDAVVHVANIPAIRGREAIHRFYENMFRFLAGSQAAPETIHVAQAGDLGYSAGSVSNAFRGAEGLVEYDGKYALIWKRSAGEWMIVLYAVSSDQPADPR